MNEREKESANEHQKKEKEVAEKTIKEKEEAEKAFLREKEGHGPDREFEEMDGPAGKTDPAFVLPGRLTEKQVESGKDMKRDKILEKMKNDSSILEIKDIVKNGGGEMAMQAMGVGAKDHTNNNEERIKQIRERREQTKEKENGRER